MLCIVTNGAEPDPLPSQVSPPPILGYRDPRDDAPPLERATTGHLTVAILGASLYLMLTAVFGLPTLLFLRQGRFDPIEPLMTCGILPAIFCAWRALAALKVITDHLRAPRYRD